MSRAPLRRRDHRVERLVPLKPAKSGHDDSSVPDLHRLGGQQARARGTRCSGTPPSALRGPDGHEAAQPDAHRGQEQDRRTTSVKSAAPDDAPIDAGACARGHGARVPVASGHRGPRVTRSGSGRSAAGRRPRGAAPDERRSRAAGRARGRRRRPPRRRRRRQDAVGQLLDALGPRPSSSPSSVSWTPTGKRSSSTSRVEYCSMSSRGEPSATIFGLVHDHEPVAQLLGLVHVVGRQDERHAALLEPVEPVPDQVARLRVEPGRGLVEQQQLGLVDERAGDREAPLHAARERLDQVAWRGR